MHVQINLNETLLNQIQSSKRQIFLPESVPMIYVKSLHLHSQSISLQKIY